MYLNVSCEDFPPNVKIRNAFRSAFLSIIFLLHCFITLSFQWRTIYKYISIYSYIHNVILYISLSYLYMYYKQSKSEVGISPSHQLPWFLASIYHDPGFEPLISQRWVPRFYPLGHRVGNIKKDPKSRLPNFSMRPSMFLTSVSVNLRFIYWNTNCCTVYLNSGYIFN